MKVSWNSINQFRGVADTRCVPPFNIYCKVHVMPWETQKISLIKMSNRRCTTVWWGIHSLKVSWISIKWFKRSWGYKMCTPFWYTKKKCILLSPCYAMGNPKNQSDQKIETKIPWKFHEITLTSLGGVANTRCVPPFDIV